MTATTSLPADLTGDYTIDAVHSRIGFIARHAMVTKVRGSFNEFSGSLHLDATNPAAASADIAIQVASVDTRNEQRDGHLRTNDFFNAPEFPTITFVADGVVAEKDDLLVTGTLTIKGVSKEVTFTVEFGGYGADLYGNYKLGLTAKAVINRNDFGVSWNAPLEAGGVLVGDDVTITIDLQAALQA